MFAEKVEKSTQGRYKVQVYPAGQLANDPKAGRAAAARRHRTSRCRAPGTYATHLPTLNLSLLPYLVENYEQGWKLYDESKWLKEQFREGAGQGFPLHRHMGSRLS